MSSLMLAGAPRLGGKRTSHGPSISCGGGMPSTLHSQRLAGCRFEFVMAVLPRLDRQAFRRRPFSRRRSAADRPRRPDRSFGRQERSHVRACPRRCNRPRAFSASCNAGSSPWPTLHAAKRRSPPSTIAWTFAVTSRVRPGSPGMPYDGLLDHDLVGGQARRRRRLCRRASRRRPDREVSDRDERRRTPIRAVRAARAREVLRPPRSLVRQRRRFGAARLRPPQLGLRPPNSSGLRKPQRVPCTTPSTLLATK